MVSKRTHEGLFVCMITLVTVLMAGAFAVDYAHQTMADAILNEAQTTEVSVVAGDTLYDIASTYAGERVTSRQMASWIYTHNHLKQSALYPGQKLDVPVL